MEKEKIRADDKKRIGHWALIWLGRFDSVYENGGMCACNPKSPCPCDDIYKERKCRCNVIFKPEDMLNGAGSKYGKKHGIVIKDDGNYVIIKMPKINRS